MTILWPNDCIFSGLNNTYQLSTHRLTNLFKEKEDDNQTKQKLTLFYKNQMTSYYKIEENHIRKIIDRHIKPKQDNIEIKLQIYYKSKKLKNLIIKNNPNPSTDNANVVYAYKCPEDSCNAVSEYVGYTTNALRKRLQQHTYKGAIKDHALRHNRVLDLNHCTTNTQVIGRNNSKQEIIILEALLIKQRKPLINIQSENFNTTLNFF